MDIITALRLKNLDEARQAIVATLNEKLSDALARERQGLAKRLCEAPSTTIRLECLECGKKFNGSTSTSSCPKCKGSDIELAESTQSLVSSLNEGIWDAIRALPTAMAVAKNLTPDQLDRAKALALKNPPNVVALALKLDYAQNKRWVDEFVANVRRKVNEDYTLVANRAGYNPPAGWDKGWAWPLQIGGNGSERPYLKDGKWKLYVWDAKEHKHYTYDFASDTMELAEGVVQEEVERFLWSYVTHDNKYNGRAVRLGGLNAPVRVTITQQDTKKEIISKTFPTERNATAFWKEWRRNVSEAFFTGDKVPAHEVQRVYNEVGDPAETEVLCNVKRLRVNQAGQVLSFVHEGVEQVVAQHPIAVKAEKDGGIPIAQHLENLKRKGIAARLGQPHFGMPVIEVHPKDAQRAENIVTFRETSR